MIGRLEIESAKMIAMEEGLEQGRELGREEGRGEGKEEIISLMLECRFSTMPDHITSRLDKLTPLQMNHLAVSIFDFNTISDLENWLNALD